MTFRVCRPAYPSRSPDADRFVLTFETKASLKGIGSVIPSVCGRPPAKATLWANWTAEAADVRPYATARAALAALLRHRRIKRLWLPAYVCRALIEAATEAQVELVWYGVDGRLNADIDAIRSDLTPEDAILTIAWFGRPPDSAFQSLKTDYPDILIVEDRAQALEAGHGIEGAVRLYSPRKLIGVADGGLLIGDDLPPPATLPALDGLWAANDRRASDLDGHAPNDWFPAYQRRETAFDAQPRLCSHRTLAALDQVDIETESDARRRNWRTLAAALNDWALWPIASPDFAPLAFPIVVADAGDLVAHLARHRIWAARHWADPPSPSHFRDAHALSRRCVSLPLDGRYTPQDMMRVAATVRAFTDAAS